MVIRPALLISKSLSSALVVLMILVGLSACAQQSTSTTPGTSQNQNPIKIGYSVALAGDFSADGNALKKGYELWRDSVNKRGGLLGRQVVLDSLDDSSKPDQVTTNYQKLIGSDRVDLVLGPFSTLLTVPAAKVAQRYNYAMVEGAGTGPKVFNSGFKTVFGASLPSETYLESFAQYILSLPQDKRPKTAAYVAVDNPFATPQIAKAIELLSKGGVKTVFHPAPYPEETTDVSPIAKQIVASKADIVLVGTVGVKDCVSFIKTFKQQRYSPQAFIATSGPDEGAQFTNAIGTNIAEGVFVPNAGWYPGVNTYQNDQFTKDYIAKYGGNGQDVNTGTVQAYSAAQVLEQAVIKAKSVDNKVLLNTLRTETFNTIQGPVKFNEKGENTIGVPFLFQWQSGKLIPVYPASQAQANPQYPKKSWA